MTHAYRYYDLILALFVTVLLVSNVASSAKLVDWGVSLPFINLPLAFDGEHFSFPSATSSVMCLRRYYGYARARRVIWVGFAMAALMGVTLWIVGRLPGELTWRTNVGQHAYDAVLGGVSHFGILAASLAAYWAGGFSNSYVLARMNLDARASSMDADDWLDTGG